MRIGAMVALGQILSAAVQGTLVSVVVVVDVLFVSLVLPIMVADELAPDRNKKPVSREPTDDPLP
jgi:hypothetical protein